MREVGKKKPQLSRYLYIDINMGRRDTPKRLYVWDEKYPQYLKSWYMIVKNYRLPKPVVCHGGFVIDHPHTLVNMVVFRLHSSRVNCVGWK